MRDLSSVDQLVRDPLTYPDRDREIGLALMHDIKANAGACFQAMALLIRHIGGGYGPPGMVKVVNRGKPLDRLQHQVFAEIILKDHLIDLVAIVKAIVDPETRAPVRDATAENPTFGMF